MTKDYGMYLDDILVDPRTYSNLNGYWPVVELANRYLHQNPWFYTTNRSELDEVYDNNLAFTDLTS